MTSDFRALLDALTGAGVDFLVIGGAAATAHGSARLTLDLDVLYHRTPENLERLVRALEPLEPYLRGAPPGLPFRFDVETVRRGLNFTLTTRAGALDVLAEIPGGGPYEALRAKAVTLDLFGREVRCLDLRSLIGVKRAAGRPKDLEVIAELEALLDEQGT